ncbi:hypothetical protein SteCoe_28796 [Stentor coeruleus]|uniref:Uncharacterized protein n=1 Tax=Stentor coeruleus TaxID=5963 RepID=A0A1R2B7F5_9CILI|nr:hypothetical protein SteCoe_28796 [Stentor coeruleus]
MEQAIFLYACLKGFHHTSSLSGIPIQTLTDFGRKETCCNTIFTNAIIQTLKKSLETMGLYDSAEYFGLTPEIFQALIDSNVERAFLFHARNVLMPYSIDRDTQTLKSGLTAEKLTGIKIDSKIKQVSNIVNVNNRNGDIEMNQASDIPPIVVLDLDHLSDLDNRGLGTSGSLQIEKTQKDSLLPLTSAQKGVVNNVSNSEIRKKKAACDANKSQFQLGNLDARENPANNILVAKNSSVYKNSSLPEPNTYNLPSNLPLNSNPPAIFTTNFNPQSGLSPIFTPPNNLSPNFNPPANFSHNFNTSKNIPINLPPKLNDSAPLPQNNNLVNRGNPSANLMTQQQNTNKNSLRNANIPYSNNPQAVNPNNKPQNTRNTGSNNLPQPIYSIRSGDLAVPNMPQRNNIPSTGVNEIPSTFKRILNPGTLPEHKPVKGTITNPDYSYIP